MRHWQAVRFRHWTERSSFSSSRTSARTWSMSTSAASPTTAARCSTAAYRNRGRKNSRNAKRRKLPGEHRFRASHDEQSLRVPRCPVVLFLRELVVPRKRCERNRNCIERIVVSKSQARDEGAYWGIAGRCQVRVNGVSRCAADRLETVNAHPVDLLCGSKES